MVWLAAAAVVLALLLLAGAVAELRDIKMLLQILHQDHMTTHRLLLEANDQGQPDPTIAENLEAIRKTLKNRE